MAHAHCMLGNWGYKHTLICNTYCFFPATMVTRKRLIIMCISTLSVSYLCVLNTYFPFQRLRFVFQSGLLLSLLCRPFSLKWWDDRQNEMRKNAKIKLTMSWRQAVDVEVEFHALEDPHLDEYGWFLSGSWWFFSGGVIQQPLGESLDGPRNKYGQLLAQISPTKSPRSEASRECGQPPNLRNT